MAKLAAAKEFAYMKALKDSLALMTWNASCLGISMLTFAGRGISCSHSYRSKPPCCGDVFREALRSPDDLVEWSDTQPDVSRMRVRSMRSLCSSCGSFNIQTRHGPRTGRSPCRAGWILSAEVLERLMRLVVRLVPILAQQSRSPGVRFDWAGC